MIFAPVYQFHIYIYILCLLGLLRDCEIFANLHLKLYLQVRAGDGPHPPLRLAAGLQPGVAGVALRSARPARGLVHQQRVVPRCQHSHHLPHHDQLRLDAGRGHISTQYLHNIYTQYLHISTQGAFLHFLLVLPFLQEARLVRLLRLLGWLAPGLCVLPYAVYRSYHEVTPLSAATHYLLTWLHNIYMISTLSTPVCAVHHREHDVVTTDQWPHGKLNSLLEQKSKPRNRKTCVCWEIQLSLSINKILL